MCLGVLVMLVVAAATIFLLVRGCGRAHAATVDLERAVRPLLPVPQEAEADPRLSLPPETLLPGQSIHELRVARGREIVRALYNHPGRANFLPYVEHLVAQHEWYEQEGTRKGYPWAEGFGAAYWYSLVYGGANFSLRCYGVAPGNCAGPLDVKHWPLVLDPRRNVDWHVGEMWVGQRKGYRDLGLCQYIMLPAAPRDWGRGRFCRTDARHRAVISKAYAERRLP